MKSRKMTISSCKRSEYIMDNTVAESMGVTREIKKGKIVLAAESV